jgi:hypothetical protein
MLMHKKEAHSLPNIPPKNKSFLVKRTSEINSIIRQGFDPSATKVVFIECKCIKHIATFFELLTIYNILEQMTKIIPSIERSMGII